MKRLYIISGCNGAGKTTASYTILPELLDCKEFVNADEIAKGLSPFNPNKVAIKAGRLMLTRIDELLESGVDFAFETTLSTRSYMNTVKKAQEKGYFVTVLYFWLNTSDLAVERVKVRVEEGGHHIPEDTIRRRYDLGISNMFNLYIPVADYWMFIDNSKSPFDVLADGRKEEENIKNKLIWTELKQEYYGS
ncbi:MAG: zeta toxin [Bacteroidetes bacterium 4572_77]|nr:MAG: zeta toxin [Bacteroidetes bacterium 4572_77]